MAFEEVDVVEATVAATTGVSVGLAKLKSAKAKLRLTIRSATFEEWGYTLDDRFVLLLGTGDDHGVIRLQKNKSGKIRAAERVFTGGVIAYTINLQHRAEFVDRSEKAVPCNWEKIDITTVEIVLPPWADETAPGKSRRIAAIPPSVAAAQKERDRQNAERSEAEQRRAERDAGSLQSEISRSIAAALKDVPEFSIDLSPSQQSILAVLAKRQGKIVSKEALMTLVYSAEGDEAPEDKILDVQICKIRPKLPIGCEIKTIWGQGYKLLGDVAALYAPQPASAIAG